MKIVVCFLLLSTSVMATTFYISPTGNDANPGTTQTTPFKTFTHVLPLLNPGDTLNLLNGTYQSGTGTGFPNIDCSGTAHNGTAAAPITIQALNERQAWIKSDGTSQQPFGLYNCTFWNVIGLHVSDDDFSSENETNAPANAAMGFAADSNLLIKRNILDHQNRCFNTQLIALITVTNSQVVENEFYYFTRHPLAVYAMSNGNEIARNYFNSRLFPNRPTTSGCTPFPSSYLTRGEGPITYGSSNNTWENNISENNGEGLNVETITNGPGITNDVHLGNISKGDINGNVVAPHTCSETATAMVFTNNVIIGATNLGMRLASSQTTTNHASLFLTAGPSDGVLSNAQGCTGTYSQTVNNSQVNGATSGPGYQATTTPGTWSGGFDHDNSFNNGSNFSTGSLSLTNSSTVNPAYGSCFLWAPDGTALKGKASDGGDIGATVLYQYVSGTLTTNRLWNATTGAPLFQGATVTGLNDVAGNSLFDIQNRLNINTNGCAFPGTFGGGPQPPTGLTIAVQ